MAELELELEDLKDIEKYRIALKKWLKEIYLEIDSIKKRLELIEEFLGGVKSMKSVVKSKGKTDGR